MITGVQDVYYNVEDMDRAVRFYTELLGMTAVDTSRAWSTLQLGDIRIGLHGSGGAPVPEIPRDVHGAYAGATLTLRSDDITADTLRLRAAGSVILGEFHEEWGKITVFQDSEGNVLKLLQPPG